LIIQSEYHGSFESSEREEDCRAHPHHLFPSFLCSSLLPPPSFPSLQNPPSTFSHTITTMSPDLDLASIPLRQHVSLPSPDAHADATTAATSSFSGSSVSFSHISYSIKTKDGEKKLINDVSIKVRAGELLGEFRLSQFWGRNGRRTRLKLTSVCFVSSLSLSSLLVSFVPPLLCFSQLSWGPPELGRVLSST